MRRIETPQYTPANLTTARALYYPTISLHRDETAEVAAEPNDLEVGTILSDLWPQRVPQREPEPQRIHQLIESLWGRPKNQSTQPQAVTLVHVYTSRPEALTSRETSPSRSTTARATQTQQQEEIAQIDIFLASERVAREETQEIEVDEMRSIADALQQDVASSKDRQAARENAQKRREEQGLQFASDHTSLCSAEERARDEFLCSETGEMRSISDACERDAASSKGRQVTRESAQKRREEQSLQFASDRTSLCSVEEHARDEALRFEADEMRSIADAHVRDAALSKDRQAARESAQKRREEQSRQFTSDRTSLCSAEERARDEVLCSETGEMRSISDSCERDAASSKDRQITRESAQKRHEEQSVQFASDRTSLCSAEQRARDEALHFEADEMRSIADAHVRDAASSKDRQAARENAQKLHEEQSLQFTSDRTSLCSAEQRARDEALHFEADEMRSIADAHVRDAASSNDRQAARESAQKRREEQSLQFASDRASLCSAEEHARDEVGQLEGDDFRSLSEMACVSLQDAISRQSVRVRAASIRFEAEVGVLESTEATNRSHVRGSEVDAWNTFMALMAESRDAACMRQKQREIGEGESQQSAFAAEKKIVQLTEERTRNGITRIEHAEWQELAYTEQVEAEECTIRTNARKMRERKKIDIELLVVTATEERARDEVLCSETGEMRSIADARERDVASSKDRQAARESAQKRREEQSVQFASDRTSLCSAEQRARDEALRFEADEMRSIADARERDVASSKDRQITRESAQKRREEQSVQFASDRTSLCSAEQRARDEALRFEADEMRSIVDVRERDVASSKDRQITRESAQKRREEQSVQFASDRTSLCSAEQRARDEALRFEADEMRSIVDVRERDVASSKDRQITRESAQKRREEQSVQFASDRTSLCSAEGHARDEALRFEADEMRSIVDARERDVASSKDRQITRESAQKRREEQSVQFASDRTSLCSAEQRARDEALRFEADEMRSIADVRERDVASSKDRQITRESAQKRREEQSVQFASDRASLCSAEGHARDEALRFEADEMRSIVDARERDVASSKDRQITRESAQKRREEQSVQFASDRTSLCSAEQRARDEALRFEADEMRSIADVRERDVASSKDRQITRESAQKRREEQSVQFASDRTSLCSAEQRARDEALRFEADEMRSIVDARERDVASSRDRQITRESAQKRREEQSVQFASDRTSLCSAEQRARDEALRFEADEMRSIADARERDVASSKDRQITRESAQKRREEQSVQFASDRTSLCSAEQRARDEALRFEADEMRSIADVRERDVASSKDRQITRESAQKRREEQSVQFASDRASLCSAEGHARDEALRFEADEMRSIADAHVRVAASSKASEQKQATAPSKENERDMGPAKQNEQPAGPSEQKQTTAPSKENERDMGPAKQNEQPAGPSEQKQATAPSKENERGMGPAKQNEQPAGPSEQKQTTAPSKENERDMGPAKQNEQPARPSEQKQTTAPSKENERDMGPAKQNEQPAGPSEQKQTTAPSKENERDMGPAKQNEQPAGPSEQKQATAPSKENERGMGPAKQNEQPAGPSEQKQTTAPSKENERDMGPAKQNEQPAGPSEQKQATAPSKENERGMGPAKQNEQLAGPSEQKQSGMCGIVESPVASCVRDSLVSSVARSLDFAGLSCLPPSVAPLTFYRDSSQLQSSSSTAAFRHMECQETFLRDAIVEVEVNDFRQIVILEASCRSLLRGAAAWVEQYREIAQTQRSKGGLLLPSGMCSSASQQHAHRAWRSGAPPSSSWSSVAGVPPEVRIQRLTKHEGEQRRELSRIHADLLSEMHRYHRRSATTDDKGYVCGQPGVPLSLPQRRPANQNKDEY